MEILLVSDQLSPYTGSGPIGECASALGRALCQLGHVVTVAMPKHEGFERHGVMVARRLTPLALGGDETATVHDGQLPSGVRLVLFDAAKHSAQAVETGEPQRAALASFLCRAAQAFAQQRPTPFDVLHVHGVAAAATLGLSSLPGVFTVYDLSDKGELSSAQLDAFGLSAQVAERFRHGANASLLLGGMISARKVVTFSPRLAERAFDVELLGAFGANLRAEAVELGSVTAGIDYAVYNPATDSALAMRYDKEATQGKAACKAALLRELELELDAELPLVVFAQPLHRDNGADLVLAAALSLCKAPLQLVVAGRGDEDLGREFASERLKRLRNFRYLEDLSAVNTRRLLAAADFVLCPNREDLLGTPIRTAQRYGAVPVVLATPVAADAVVDCPSDLSSGTGFSFDEPSSDGLCAATERAVAMFREPLFARLRRRIMGLDLGWERAARRYAQLYKVVTSGSHLDV